MEYKGYLLDPFQIEAIQAIDKNHTAIVCAPTGAGKTLIAEYIIERCLSSGRRVIYTAPIKALSNQKYRQFTKNYPGDVGIITGDVVLNEFAPALIMTTEIFRNILFEDESRLREVDYVIFDEVHFIEDPRRGTIWEESIMLAPKHIHFLCLSATIANIDEFKNWMRSIRGDDLSVIIDTRRPVPLDFNLFVEGKGIYPLSKLQAALDQAAQIKEKIKQARHTRKKQTIKGPSLFELLKKAGRMPVLCFSFSRKNCEKLAYNYRYMDLLDRDESQRALEIFDEFIRKNELEEYSSTAQLRDLIARGIAYHHAGLLPMLKEIIEELFSRGLIRLLFATETFAVGVNMPAKSVVFHSLEKNDGVQFRYLKCYEFLQMAGRAGRRGMDERGYVYATIDPTYLDPAEVRRVLKGKPEPLESQFGFSYSSILNLLSRYNREKLEQLARMSFGYYQHSRELEEVQKAHREAIMAIEQIDCVRGNARKELERLMSLEKQLSLATASLEEQLKLGYRTNRHNILQAKKKVAELKRSVNREKCSNCKKRHHCLNFAFRLQDIRARLERLADASGFNLERKLAFLTELGYIDGDTVLPRGQVARDIFGYEIVATELYFDGFFKDLDVDTIAAVLSGIVFENRNRWTVKPASIYLREILTVARRKVERLLSLELTLLGTNTISPIESCMAQAAHDFSQGADFQDVLSSQTILDEGDLIRLFRNIVDLARQMRRAFREDETTAAKFEEVIRRMCRDVVDASRYL